MKNTNKILALMSIMVMLLIVAPQVLVSAARDGELDSVVLEEDKMFCTFSNSSYKMFKNETLYVSVFNVDAANTVWKSSKSKVVAIEADGNTCKLIAKKKGTTEITVTNGENIHAFTIKVTKSSGNKGFNATAKQYKSFESKSSKNWTYVEDMKQEVTFFENMTCVGWDRNLKNIRLIDMASYDGKYTGYVDNEGRMQGKGIVSIWTNLRGDEEAQIHAPLLNGEKWTRSTATEKYIQNVIVDGNFKDGVLDGPVTITSNLYSIGLYDNYDNTKDVIKVLNYNEVVVVAYYNNGICISQYQNTADGSRDYKISNFKECVHQETDYELDENIIGNYNVFTLIWDNTIYRGGSAKKADVIEDTECAMFVGNTWYDLRKCDSKWSNIYEFDGKSDNELTIEEMYEIEDFWNEHVNDNPYAAYAHKSTRFDFSTWLGGKELTELSVPITESSELIIISD